MKARHPYLVINWWSYASDVTMEVFSKKMVDMPELNETAYIQAIDPTFGAQGKIQCDLATA